MVEHVDLDARSIEQWCQQCFDRYRRLSTEMVYQSGFRAGVEAAAKVADEYARHDGSAYAAAREIRALAPKEKEGHG